ncbi:MAG: hypothetical protein JWN70_3301 [Planctomycetaceae bacterium]|nr:hypothetical protein [Planctomycetaceae bacterium]
MRRLPRVRADLGRRREPRFPAVRIAVRGNSLERDNRGWTVPPAPDLYDSQFRGRV